MNSMVNTRLNPHAHSIHSDGEVDMETMNAIGIAKGVHIIGSDHNNVDGHRGETFSHVGAGVELKSSSGVDVVLAGNQRDVVQLFDDVFAPKLNPRNPVFGEIGMPTYRISGIGMEAGLEPIIVHPGTCEGAGVLSRKEQAEIAKQGPLVEINGRLGDNPNAYASHYARHFRQTIIAGGDSHIMANDQYTSTFNEVDVDEDMAPHEILRHIRLNQGGHKMQVSRPKLREALATARQVLKSGGRKVAAAFAKCLTRRMIDGRQNYFPTAAFMNAANKG